jgi:hypothetical protein
MGKGRPGGNPALVKHQFQTERGEPLTEHLQLRIAASVKQQLQLLPDYKEFVRQAIAEKLARENIEK